MAVANQERSGWRDEALSARHREWGFNCPGVDLDLVMLEYHLAQPVAIVEYKHQRAQWPDLSHPTYVALGELADRQPALPFLIARYWPETWAFHLIAVNETARHAFGGEDETRCSEQQYVRFLHQLRQVLVQEQVIRRLNTVAPPPRLSIVA